MGGLSFPHLSVGTYCARCGALALREAAPGGLLALDHIFGGVLGAGVYVVAEMIPDLGLLRGTFPGFAGARGFKTSKFRFLDNPSAGNLEELAELYFEQKKYAKARELLNRAISARNDSPHAFYLGRKRRWEWEILRRLFPTWSTSSGRTRNLTTTGRRDCSANAYARTGDLEKAAIYFAPAARFPRRQRRYTTTQAI